MRKLLAILLAIMMAISLAPVASADLFVSAIAMNDDEIATHAGSYYDQVIYAARFKDGLVAIMHGDHLGYFVNGELVMRWDYPTSEEDFFFYVKDAYPKAEYDLCVMLGTTVYSIRNNLSMHEEISDVSYYGFDLDFAYIFAIRSGALYYWSPYALVQVSDSDVYDMVVNVDYAFFDDASGGHVINASLRDMSRMTMRYYMYHPLQICDLPSTFWDWYGEVYGWDENGLVDQSADFDQQFGIDFSGWGNPKLDFAVEDFLTYPGMTVNELESIFDSPIEDYSNPIQFADISFYGHNGTLVAYYVDEATFKYIRWVSDSGSLELTEELKAIVAERGGFVKHNSFQDSNAEEDVYDVGGQMVHVGYQLIDDTIISFVYANNKYLTDE